MSMVVLLHNIGRWIGRLDENTFGAGEVYQVS